MKYFLTYRTLLRRVCVVIHQAGTDFHHQIGSAIWHHLILTCTESSPPNTSQAQQQHKPRHIPSRLTPRSPLKYNVGSEVSNVQTPYYRIGGEMTQKPLEVIAGAPDRPLVIGDITIPCYVLENSDRVITQRGLYDALGISRGGTRKSTGAQIEEQDSNNPKNNLQNEQNLVELPRFAQQNWLYPYIRGKLLLALKSPISFYRPPNRTVSYGFSARILTRICRAIIQANNDGATTARQLNLVR